jgi:hypothetical protein
MPSTQDPSPAQRVLRILAMVVIALAGVLVIAFSSHPAQKDFISYWSAGKLLLHHADPYSYPGVLAMEHSAGYSDARPIIMRNPPWAAFLIAPLGMLSPLAAMLLWTLALLACVIIFLRLQKIPARDAMLPFLFAPVAASLSAGQSSPFLLLGFVLFLYLEKRRPFAAGASLLLLALKPHLFLMFWAVLLLEAIAGQPRRERLKSLAGLAVALLCTTGIALLFDPLIWQHYIAMLHTAELRNEFLPTLSELLRMAININTGWLLFVPTGLALIWAVFFYLRRRSQWDWASDGMLLMLVAVLTSPYGWFSDQVVLLPAIVFALRASSRRRFSTEILIALNAMLLFIVLVLHPPLTSVAYAWAPAAWFGWYLYAVKNQPAE